MDAKSGDSVIEALGTWVMDEAPKKGVLMIQTPGIAPPKMEMLD